MSDGLWHPYKIPVVVLAGEAGSGKTMWGLTIDGSVLDFSIPPKVITWDTEGSSAPYENCLNFKRVDMVQKCVQAIGSKYTAQDMFTLWKKDVESIPPKKYTVAMVDTISEIEEGQAEYVKKHPAEFGYTSAQFAKAVPLMWGVVKSEYKRVLMALASKVETLVITVHMRSEFKGSRPTGKRKPKGKETLMDIASLFMVLDRKAQAGKKDPPALPSGICNPPDGKSRLVGVFDGKMKPLLPPFLKDASPDGIRAYLAIPPDFNNLKLHERARPEISMNDDDRLEMRAAIASDGAAKANAELATEELRQEVKGEVPPGVREALSHSPDFFGEAKAAAPKLGNRLTIALELEDKVKAKLLDKMSMKEAKLLLKTKFNVPTLSSLTDEQIAILDEYIDTLKNPQSGQSSSSH